MYVGVAYILKVVRVMWGTCKSQVRFLPLLSSGIRRVRREEGVLSVDVVLWQ